MMLELDFHSFFDLSIDYEEKECKTSEQFSRYSSTWAEVHHRVWHWEPFWWYYPVAAQPIEDIEDVDCWHAYLKYCILSGLCKESSNLEESEGCTWIS